MTEFSADGRTFPDRLIWERDLRAPLLRQVCPTRIARFNQRNLLSSDPAFELLFAINGPSDVVEAFVIHKAIAGVPGRKALNFTPLVLQRAPIDAVRHTDVQSAGIAADDVDEVFVLSH